MNIGNTYNTEAVFDLASFMSERLSELNRTSLVTCWKNRITKSFQNMSEFRFNRVDGLRILKIS